eukprot:TRINITY_DN16120_c0_g1_i1.p1 TRINITY_DN16120_c0_g1~~TRINITY_DN16120_c0_g1_i1.p1  ORF type:complete len:648 (+),score=71.37 TRINITY_DN16120_c0_g1_i1:69-2012(+)
MVSQAQGFVHLLATAIDGAHEPQVFRMRWDQPLRRFARAYAIFREVGADAADTLRMETTNHGQLDPAATAGVYGLTDGDQVVFSGLPERGVTVEAPLSRALPPAVATGAAKSVVSTPRPAMTPPTPTPAAAAPQHRPGGYNLRSNVTQDPQEQLVLVSSGAATADPPAAPPKAPTADGPRFKCRVKGCPVKYARWVGFLVESNFRRHVREHHPEERASQLGDMGLKTKRRLSPRLSSSQRAASGKPKLKGGLTDQMPRGRSRGGRGVGCGDKGMPAQGTSARGRGRGRSGAVHKEIATQPACSAVKSASGHVGNNSSMKKAAASVKSGKDGVSKKLPSFEGGASDAQDAVATREESNHIEPNVPRGLIRSETVKTGPAKGWKVMAWLQNISGCKGRTHDSAVRWRIVSPGRTRVFGAFRSTVRPNLQDEASEGVYTQIYSAIRPQLMRRITHRRDEIEGRPAKRRSCSGNLESCKSIVLRTPPAKSHNPAPLCASDSLATQQFTPEQGTMVVSASKSAWACCCDAHLRRHPRCVFSGHSQPSQVHLRDYMLIGRGEACDLVLDSKRTPQMISRCHVVLHREEGVFALVDQGSLNGVLVNGRPIRGKQALAHRDVITFGVPTPQPEFDYIFELRPEDVAHPPETQELR